MGLPGSKTPPPAPRGGPHHPNRGPVYPGARPMSRSTRSRSLETQISHESLDRKTQFSDHNARDVVGEGSPCVSLSENPEGLYPLAPRPPPDPFNRHKGRAFRDSEPEEPVAAESEAQAARVVRWAPSGCGSCRRATAWGDGVSIDGVATSLGSMGSIRSPSRRHGWAVSGPAAVGERTEAVMV
jgi:hypothetical protein